MKTHEIQRLQKELDELLLKQKMTESRKSDIEKIWNRNFNNMQTLQNAIDELKELDQKLIELGEIKDKYLNKINELMESIDDLTTN